MYIISESLSSILHPCSGPKIFLLQPAKDPIRPSDDRSSQTSRIQYSFTSIRCNPSHRKNMCVQRQCFRLRHAQSNQGSPNTYSEEHGVPRPLHLDPLPTLFLINLDQYNGIDSLDHQFEHKDYDRAYQPFSLTPGKGDAPGASVGLRDLIGTAVEIVSDFPKNHRGTAPSGLNAFAM